MSNTVHRTNLILLFLLSVSIVCNGQTVDNLLYSTQFAHNSSVIDAARAETASAISGFAHDLISLRRVSEVDILDITVRGRSSREWLSSSGSPIQKEDSVALTVAAVPADTAEFKSSFYFALKNNIVYDAALVANLGLEISLGKHFSLDLPFTFSPYDIRDDYRMRTLSVQPELRYYFKRGGRGHYLGLHGNLAYYNVATPFNTRTRYQDRDGEHPLYGGGISYGYSLPFGKDSRWGMEFTIGAGYAYLDYDCFYNVNNGAWFTKDTKHYFGIDKAGITICYRIVDKSQRKE